ncbi:MAG: magnesium transporter [Cyclobacteriaceae bacterium]|jgi:magnesium transporter|nr:magnesium transporter [Cyclobacteriaceae bacterium]
MEFELNREFRDRFQEALNEQDDNFIRQSLEEVNPADITALLYEFSGEESKYVLDLLPLETRSKIINDLDSDTRKTFLANHTTEEIIQVLNLLDSDDVADILNELPIKTSEEIIPQLDVDLKSQVIDLLRYDENVAGGLMAKELIKALDHWTVVQCVEEIRKQAEYVGKFYVVYVVDSTDKLLGRVSLQKLIISDPRTLVKDILDDVVEVVETYMEDREVAEIMSKYDLESVPVVNVQGQLVGRITIDDVVDVITEQAEEERQLMSGITEDIEEDDSVWRNTRARLPWLLIGILGGMVSARFMGFFELEIAKITAIAFFIPLIQATGGNVGIQSSSLVVQSLVSPGFVDEGLWKRLLKVFSVALLNGLFLSLIVFAINRLVFGRDPLNMIVSMALFFVVIFASFIGTVTPLILNKMGFNPAMASGPFITTTNDLLGLAVYFTTIHLFL